jgi:hypothetical protein
MQAGMNLSSLGTARQQADTAVGREARAWAESARELAQKQAALDARLEKVGARCGLIRRKRRAARQEALDRSFAKAAAAVIDYEGHVSSAKPMLYDAAQSYRLAGLHQERQHAFDAFTMHLRKLWIKSLEAIEAVERWRAQVPAEDRQLRAGQGLSPPEFIWNGANFLLQLSHGLDFLGDVPELCEWYGLMEYPMRRNPFCRGASLDERASTPRGAMKTTIIAGVEVLEFSAALARARESEVEMCDEMNAKLARAVPWWPSHACGDEMKARVRAAEKVLLTEERLYGGREQRYPCGGRVFIDMNRR